MKTFRSFNGQYGRVFMAVAVMFGAVAPALIPAVALAAQVTERSIELSNSTPGADQSGSYKVTFTPATDAESFVVDFCQDSPTVGLACGAITGFDTSGVTSTDTVAAVGTKAVSVVKTLAAGTPVTVTLNDIDNPTNAGQIFARIITYAANNGFTGYTSVAPGAHLDEGGVALSFNNDIKVSGEVAESMVFCISSADIANNCADADLQPLKLGTNGALNSDSVSEATMYTQISTNAVGGAVINLKNNNECGGLKRAAAAANLCDIEPTLAANVANGSATFGVRTSTATSTSGTVKLAPVALSGYNNSTFALNWVSGNDSGVSSPYGDPFLDTANSLANNQNMQITFGASAANDTPAGLYTADLSMIATGKF